ncbi:MAG: hypothetical protein PHU85_20610, partial [Phycisphaerae bacterium]|nr:hypothetical protein [Phycisphaerae bacterium]
ISLVDVKLPGADNPAPSVDAALVVDLGEKPEAAVGHVDHLLKALLPAEMQAGIKAVEIGGTSFKSLQPAPGVPMVFWGVVKNHLVVALGQATAEKIVDLIGGKADAKDALAADPQFAKVTGKTGPGLFYLYANVDKFRTQLLPGLLAMAPKDDATMANKLIVALGGDAIDALGCATRTDGADWVRQSYVLAPRGKPGLLVLADQKPINANLLAAVPADSTFAVVVNMNRPRILDELEKQLAAFPEAKKQFDDLRKQIEDAIGLNLRTDLAEAIGDGVAIYNSPSAGGFLFTTLTGVCELKDAAKLKAAMPKLEAAIMRLLVSTDASMAEKVTFKADKFKGYDYRYVATTGVPMPFAPAWCLTDKHLVFSLFPQSLKAALLQIEAGKPGSLLANDWLAKHLAGQAKGASAVFYLNQRQLLRIAYPVLLPVWQVVCSMAAKEGVQLDVNALPRLDVLTQYVGDAFGAMVPDADGVLFTGRSATPLPNVGGAALVLPGLGTAILLPSLSSAMEAGQRTQSMANLCGLGKSMKIYASRNNGKYPDSLDQLVKDGLAAPESLRSPRQKGQEVAYIYIKPVNPDAEFDVHVILAYERPENYNNQGTNVLFLDGHAAWKSMAQFKELQKEQAELTKPAARETKPPVPAPKAPEIRGSL